MNHAQIVDLANAIRNVQPDWQQPGIVSQLKILATGWRGSDAAFHLHAMQVAANPSARNPGALNAIPQQPTRRVFRLDDNDKCFICGDTVVRHGRSDHEFETAEEAKANAVPCPPEVKRGLADFLAIIKARRDSI